MPNTDINIKQNKNRKESGNVTQRRKEQKKDGAEHVKKKQRKSNPSTTRQIF